jgi:hypothetical protein
MALSKYYTIYYVIIGIIYSIILYYVYVHALHALLAVNAVCNSIVGKGLGRLSMVDTTVLNVSGI